MTLLSLGESLRENPRTILLSFPVLGFAVVWYTLTENYSLLAGAYGHLALSFRLFYKHHWKNTLLLKTAYSLLARSAEIGTGEGQPTVRMVMGTIGVELRDFDQAQKDFEQGIEMAKKIKDLPQAAYVESHLGHLFIKKGEYQQAKKHLDAAYKSLLSYAKDKADPRPHIWLSNAELGFSEYFLALRDKSQAKEWADQAALRADKYHLETRKLDIVTLMKKINLTVLLYWAVLRSW